MTTPTAPSRIRDFVAEVAAHFDDLPESDRQDLLDDLEQHLLELAAEDEQGLAAELTSPADYAADLRHSAGLPDRRPDVAAPSRMRRLLDRATVRARRAAAWPPVAQTLDFLPELRPAWWLVRAWALLAVLAMLTTGGPWTRHVPIPGRSLLGVMALLGAIAISVKAGREGADRSGAWRIADAAAAIATVVVLVGAASSGPAVEYVEVFHDDWQPPILRHPDGEPITNLYLYDLDGNPLTDVLVHDGLGRPVEIGDLQAAGFEDIETIHRRDRFGVPVRHLYPLEQYLVGTDDGGQLEQRPRPEPFPSPSASPETPASPRPSDAPTEVSTEGPEDPADPADPDSTTE